MFDAAEGVSARPLWLVTLADLALLLIGFFVLLQAQEHADGKALARALRYGFGGAASAVDAPRPLPVASAAINGFVPGSAVLPENGASLVGWARTMTSDPRTMLVITGGAGATPDDVDPTTRSGAVLATDRARAVAALLARQLPGIRLSIAAAGQARAAVTVTLGFAGDPASPSLGTGKGE
ncbi:MAG: flagellar motor protein MotB [Sphingomonas sp.]